MAAAYPDLPRLGFWLWNRLPRDRHYLVVLPGTLIPHPPTPHPTTTPHTQTHTPHPTPHHSPTHHNPPTPPSHIPTPQAEARANDALMDEGLMMGGLDMMDEDRVGTAGLGLGPGEREERMMIMGPGGARGERAPGRPKR